MINDSIDYWQKYTKKPYDYKNPDDNQIYIMMFFTGKRTLFLRKDLTYINTFETRKAKQLLSNAIDRKWTTGIFEKSRLGTRPEGYPKECDIAYYIEINKPS